MAVEKTGSPTPIPPLLALRAGVPRIGMGKLVSMLLEIVSIDALEWLVAMCSDVPDKDEQMVRYYGYYSNVSRGKRKKADVDDKIPCILEPELTDMAFRKNWARLIQKIYEVDPLKCPKCQGPMRVIAFHKK